jgi:hypothetical protein
MLKNPRNPKNLICDDREGAIRKSNKMDREHTKAPETEDLFLGIDKNQNVCACGFSKLLPK